MTRKTLSHSLLIACLAVVSLTACQGAPFLPGSAAVTAADAIVVDSGDGGTAQMNVTAEAPNRRVLYVQADIHHLALELYRVEGSAETRVATVTLTAAQLSRTVTFSQLRRQTSYRVRAIAYASDDTVINHLDTSVLNFTVDTAEAVSAQAVPVRLKNTLVVEPGVSQTVGITVTEAQSLPTASMTLRTLELSNLDLTFNGSNAIVNWTSNLETSFDYDVEVYQADTPTNRVATTATDAETGQSHAKTLDMGTLPDGQYLAKVTVKNNTARASTQNAATYTAPVANAISNVQLSVDNTHGLFTVAWDSSSADAFDYDIVVKTAADHQVIYESTAVNPEGGQAHQMTDDAYAFAGNTYYAVVTVKGTSISAQSPPVSNDAFGGGIPGGGDPGWGGSTIF